MDFLSNGIHQLYSELELDDEFFFTSNLSSDIEISMKSDYDTKAITTFTTYSSPTSSSNLSTSCTYNYLTNDHKGNFVEEFENILTNDYGKSFDEPLQNDYDGHNIDNYLMFGTDQYCKIESWENTLLDNFIELPELTDILPEKTPLCNDSCNSFLKESSDNLNKFRPLSMINNNEYIIEEELQKRVLPTISSAATSSSSSLTKTLSQTQYDNNNEKITYPCTFGNCTKIYAKPAHLKAHLRRHYGDKPYICTWPNCTWKFSRSDELARHKRSHSGIKPYECIYCTKCFARSDHLAKHRKVHERKIAANKLKGIIPTAAITIVRPGRRPKNMSI